jgi:hypothetical protein
LVQVLFTVLLSRNGFEPACAVPGEVVLWWWGFRWWCGVG